MEKKGTNFIVFILIFLFCTNRFWGINLPWYISVIVRIIEITFLVAINNFKIVVTKKSLKVMKYTIIPIISLIIYSCFIWLFVTQVPPMNVVRNLFTSSAYLIIDLIFGILLYNRYRENTVNMFVKYSFFSYIIGSIIPLIIIFPTEGIKFLLTSHSTNTNLLYLTEVNDLTFGIGFCLLYYLVIDKEHSKSNLKNIIMCLLMIFWGLKRIEIAALVICYLFFKFVIEKISIKKSAIISTITVMLVSYAYVMIIHNADLINLANKYNINFMGRIPTYVYVANEYSNFSPSFLGIGFGYIDEILEDLVKIDFKIGYIPIISLHSDILRMYIGVGFIAFGVWIFYQCYLKTSLLDKHVDNKAAKAYLIFTIYSFIIYLTDNTYNYPITFCLYFVCTLCSIKEILFTKESLIDK